MSETRIVDIIEFLYKSSRVINLKIRLRMTCSFTIWDSTFRKQTRCTTESWSSKQSSQDIIIYNIQTMRASDCVIPPQLRVYMGEQLDFHTHKTHVKFPKQDITSSIQLLALSHDIFIILATIT